MAGGLDVLPFTATKGGRGNDSNPSEPLDENEEQGVNIGGDWYKVKIKVQVYSQAKVIGALSAILDINAPQETDWLETEGLFVCKTIFTDEGQDFGKQFNWFCASRHINHVSFDINSGKIQHSTERVVLWTQQNYAKDKFQSLLHHSATINSEKKTAEEKTIWILTFWEMEVQNESLR